LQQIALVLVDEVHLLNEAGRGSALEAGCICRLKAIAALPEMAKVGQSTFNLFLQAATFWKGCEQYCCKDALIASAGDVPCQLSTPGTAAAVVAELFH
jgi:hypothetical protein